MHLLRTALLLLSLLLLGALIGSQLEGEGAVEPLLLAILIAGLLLMLMLLERRHSIPHSATTLSAYLQAYQPLLEIFRDNRYFYIRDADGHLSYLSPSVRDVLGYQADELNTHYSKLLSPHPLNDKLADYTAMCLRGELPPSYELEVIRKDGERCRLQIAEGPLFAGDGNLIGIQGVALDITERVLMAERLQVKEARLLEAQKLSRVGSWEWKMNSGEIFWSEEIYRLFGKGPDFTPSSDSFINVVHPDDRERVMGAVQTALSNAEGDSQGHYSMEYRLLRDDGDVRYVNANGRVFLDAEGKPWRMVGTVEDVTERTLTGNQLRRSNKLTAALSEAQIQFIQGHGLNATFTSLLQQLMMIGRCSRGLVTQYLDDDRLRLLAVEGDMQGSISGADLSMTGSEWSGLQGMQEPCLLQGAELNDMAYPESLTCLKEDGLNILMPFTDGERTLGMLLLSGGEEAAPWLFENATPILSTCSSLLLADLSERARQHARDEILRLNTELEQRVAERTEDLQLANRELESFSYSVSHDLRAPLRSIDGFSRLLINNHADHLDETGIDYLGRVRAASLRMGKLIDDLLELSRVIRSTPRRVQCNLSGMAVEIMDELRDGQTERDVAIDVAPGMVANADPVLLRAAMENLLGNAWKFTSQQEKTVIHVTAREREQGDAVYCIKDNGAGFDMAYADKLFSPFQRLHTTEEFEGSGIGLATVQRIIFRHGGRIWAHAETNKGAEFCFTLGEEVQGVRSKEGGASNA